MDSGELVIDPERPGSPAPTPKKSAKRMRRQVMLAAVGLGLVYLLIAVAFLHEWGLDSTPLSDSGRGPVSAPPHTVKAAVAPKGGAASEWTPPGVPLLLQIPDGWNRSVQRNALVLAPSDAADEIAVRLYYERGDRPLADTARSAGDYLKRLAGGASIGRPTVGTVAGRRALSVQAHTQTARHKATVWILDGVRYLVLEQVRRSAKPELKAEERQLVASLRPAHS